MLLTLALAALTPQGPGSSPAPVCINEFNYDDNGADDLEFVELFNRTAAPVDISGWVLQGEEGDAAGAANGSFTFPGSPGSMTTVINPGQYLLVSQPNVPNHDPNLVMPSTMMENGGGTTAPGADGLTLRDSLGNVVDSVAWEYAGWSAPVPPWLEGTGLQGSTSLNVSSPGLNGATPQRWLDGYDDDNNGGDFIAMEWTPGAPNNSLNLLFPPLVETFDGAAGSTVDHLFSSSFVSPLIQDPAVVTTSGGGLWALPASPQGGNVAALHDATGGGNSHIARTFPATDMLVECYVYVAGGNAALTAQEGESWAIGVGTTDSFAHPVDVAGTYYPGLLCNIGNGPGASGIAWIAYNRTAQTEIYLVDLNDGGPGFTILAGPIVATPGAGDGWQRLRLRVAGSSVLANFGGTFGVDDGQRFTATVSPRYFGQAYLQYRECISVNTNMRPLVVDALEIQPAIGSSVLIAGTASPTTVALPAIGTAGGNPDVGNAAFQFTAGGLIPNGISIAALDTVPLLPGVPVPGAPATLRVYVPPTVTATIFNSGAGTAVVPLPIPATYTLLGVVVSTQFFDLDLALMVPLPFGSSPGCQATIGNG